VKDLKLADLSPATTRCAQGMEFILSEELVRAAEMFSEASAMASYGSAENICVSLVSRAYSRSCAESTSQGHGDSKGALALFKR
jgi:hypothetical protein